jgi:hypothetical protein
MQTRSTDTRVCARAVVACPCLQRSTVKPGGFGTRPRRSGAVISSCCSRRPRTTRRGPRSEGNTYVRGSSYIPAPSRSLDQHAGRRDGISRGAAARRRRGHARPEPLYQPADTPSDPTLPRRPAGDAEQAPCTARGAATADGRRRPRPRTRAACMQGVHRTAASSVDTVARPRTHPRVARGARARPGCMHA